MKKGIIQNFQFYEMKAFKNGQNISDGKYLTISLDFVRFCEGIFRLEDYSKFIHLNEIFDGQEQQSNSDICLNQEIQYTFISS